MPKRSSTPKRVKKSDIAKAMLLNFSEHNTGNGSLTMFQQSKMGIPFAMKKVLVVRGMKPNDVRGLHAHKKTNEVVSVLQGGCDVEVSDGEEVRSFTIHTDSGVYLPAKLWRVLKNFEPNTVLLIIADTPYNEKDYVRDWDAFLRMRKL